MKTVFKVKLIDGGWVFWNQFGIIISISTDNEGIHLNKYISQYKVITETVCQFTGITDKNNIDIFENDLLSDGNIIYKVEWNQQNTCWWINPIKTIKKSEISEKDSFITLVLSNEKLGNGYYSRRDMEVIGNTIDDLNLLS